MALCLGSFNFDLIWFKDGINQASLVLYFLKHGGNVWTFPIREGLGNTFQILNLRGNLKSVHPSFFKNNFKQNGRF